MKRLLAVWLASAGLAAASDLDFQLVNATARSFEAVYVSAVEDKDWDGNLLSNRMVFAPGKTLTVKFPAEAKASDWDIHLVDDEGLTVRFQAVRLDSADRLTVVEKSGHLTLEVE
jgi:hypothetical protein